MSDNNLAAMLAEVEEFKDATAEQWAEARFRMQILAPDLYECVIGEAL